MVVGVFIIANLLSFASLWALRQGNFYKPSFLVNEVKQQDFDYIVLGASTGLTTLNTMVIDSMTHKSGINLSMDDTNLPSQYVMLQHFLAQGKSTDVCILAPSVTSYGRNNDRLSDNDYRFLPYVGRLYVSEYYQTFGQIDAKLLSLSQWQPMLGVSYYNAELFYPSLLSLFKPERHNRFDDRGNYTYPYKKTDASEIAQEPTMNLKFNNRFLAKIQRLCDANDIKLICYISPLKKISVKVNAPSYKIINHADVLQNDSYYYDDIHVNSKGRQFVSAKFANDVFAIFKNQ